MIARRALLAAGLGFAATPAFAIDPGVASGRYEHDGVTLNLKHAVALSQDNAEGLLDHPRQIRLLLSETEVPPAALYGVIFPPVRAMARAGTVRGLLLEFDPADRTGLQQTLLSKPDDPRFSLPNLSRSDSSGLWNRLDVSDTRIAGELKGDEDQPAISFSAPVFTDAVQADLKGPAAQQSEQVRVLVARAEAIGKGDMDAAFALTTEEAAARLRALPPEVMQGAKAQMPQLLKQLRGVKRVVVRRETAAVQGPDGWFSLALRDGAWKVAD